MHTTRGDGVAGIKRRHRDLSSDGVRNLAMASGRGRLKRGSRIIYVATASGLQSDEMDDPNITMEEYIRLEEEKARRHDEFPAIVYNDALTSELEVSFDFENEFPAIVYNDALTSEPEVSSEPTVSAYPAIKVDFDFKISSSDSDDEDYTIIYDKTSFSCKLVSINDLKSDSNNVEDKINIKQSSGDLSIEPLPNVSIRRILGYGYGVSTSCTVLVIMEYFVKISYKARILKLKIRVRKSTDLTTNTPYYSRPIRRLIGVNSVGIPSARSSSSKNSVLLNTKIHSEVVEVYAKKNKKTNVTSRMNVVKTKKQVANIDTKNALKAKIDILCVSCEKNVLTPCNDNCLAKYKLSVKTNV
ncbi:hypothetical protein Tco_1458233 [Tanacetum coccineum]